MGLDMYLYKKEYVKNWEHTQPEHRYHITYAKGDGKPVEINPSYLVTEVGYWRKANAIHRWFVDNVQGGVDECQHSYVDSEQLEELRDIVKQLLEGIKTVDGDVSNGTTYYGDGRIEHHTTPGRIVTNPELCDKLLPTQDGCFFGGTGYDEWYIQGLELTKEILDRVLKEHAEDSEKGRWYDYEYHASW